MRYDPIGSCWLATTAEEIRRDGWEILTEEDFKPGVKRYHATCGPNFRMVYVDTGASGLGMLPREQRPQESPRFSRPGDYTTDAELHRRLDGPYVDTDGTLWPNGKPFFNNSPRWCWITAPNIS